MLKEKQKKQLYRRHEMGVHLRAHFYKETKRAIRRISGNDLPIHDVFNWTTNGPILKQVGESLEEDIMFMENQFMNNSFENERKAISYLSDYEDYKKFLMNYINNSNKIENYAMYVLKDSLTNEDHSIVLNVYEAQKILEG